MFAFLGFSAQAAVTQKVRRAPHVPACHNQPAQLHQRLAASGGDRAH